ncbi:MAG: hypothetical protein KZY55_09070 [Paeniclostridium sp.]|uniref:hypothetical protein n=1 Tax=Paraclostridium sordellii TaxID=1505 RepID=UPI0005E46590|nr:MULTISPECIES: hypothetical protein [Paeniclostridium]MBW4862861.1 hypothetical protein [Paeniclostridium sp.]MBW4874204.1 hypothetical protein [Paeniclostridium sp.]CEN93038.1 membrane protein [[Clostridium] sordellii] [Paeniclostridium sordellii]CEN95859.1 membrane protein [[Clostridium] sordellii] [Paeniclostridium sordellii]
MKTKSLKSFKWIVYLIYIFSFIYFLSINEKGKAFICFVSFLIAFILSKFYFRNFKVVDKPLYVVGNLFIILSFLLGSCYGLYDIFKPYDSILHFLSGFITVKIGLNILRYIFVSPPRNLLDKVLFFLVVFFFSLGVSGICEIVEYLLDTYLNMKTQGGGLADTMKDMIYASCGAILMIIYYLKKYSIK